MIARRLASADHAAFLHGGVAALSTAGPLDIRRSRTLVGPVRIIDLGFEIGGLLDQARCHIRVRDCPCKFEKRSCLTRQILPAHHCCYLPLACPQKLRCNAGNRSEHVLRSAHLIFVPSDAAAFWVPVLPEPTPADHVFSHENSGRELQSGVAHRRDLGECCHRRRRRLLGTRLRREQKQAVYPYVVAAATSSPSTKAAAASPAAGQPARLIDQTPVRVIGAPFVPNTNPRER